MAPEQSILGQWTVAGVAAAVAVPVSVRARPKSTRPVRVSLMRPMRAQWV